MYVDNITPKVDSIQSMEKCRFKPCLHCNKKIKQVTAPAVVKCDNCGHAVRNLFCKENLMTKISGSRNLIIL